MEILTLPSPAKINLFLHVTGQRDDGYHELQTVFQFLDFADEIQFKPSDSLHFHSETLNIPDEENLITRAAKLLQDHTGTKQRAEIFINKQIPLGGGLGGGSSNAATTLLGLNALWDTQLSLDELTDLGLQLGADVPIFIHGKAAWAEGVGEALTTIAPQESWVLVITPPSEVCTKTVFQHENLTRDSEKITIRDFLSSGGQNDCEPVTRSLYPAVEEAITWLNRHASARMSGTGSSVFAEFADQGEATRLLEELPSQFTGLVTKTMNKSPVHTALLDWGVAKR